MIAISDKCDKFKTTKQRLADEARLIIKKSWFYDLGMLEIHQQIHRKMYQQDLNAGKAGNYRKTGTSY